MKIYLFNIIPIFSNKKKNDKIIARVLGIPFLKIYIGSERQYFGKKILFSFACKQKFFKRDVFLLVDNTFNNEAELTDNFSLFEY